MSVPALTAFPLSHFHITHCWIAPPSPLFIPLESHSQQSVELAVTSRLLSLKSQCWSFLLSSSSLCLFFSLSAHAPLAYLISSYTFMCHLYADDTQFIASAYTFLLNARLNLMCSMQTIIFAFFLFYLCISITGTIPGIW